MNKLRKKTELSIIIVSYNSQKELPVCLDSIYKFNGEKIKSGLWEILIVDNTSTDGTDAWLRQAGENYPRLEIYLSKENLGFGAGNNLGVTESSGQFVLFLNPDTVVEKRSIEFPLRFLSLHPDVGAVTAKTVLGNGQLDATCHRGFPTPWNAFCYFSGLTKLFPHTRLFAGYTLGYLDPNKPHEVDSINGAFFLMPRSLGEKLKWFDEYFFWKGEDLDLCYRIKQLGYKIMYFPQVKVWHFKGSSKGHQPGSRTLSARFEVMRLFYDKHYKSRYPLIVRALVLTGIKLREIMASFGL